MDIKIIDNFFSKTAYSDYKLAFQEPKWELIPHITTANNRGSGLQRYFAIEEGAFHLSLYPAHIISRELDKEYYIHRMRFRVTWPCKNSGSTPHIDAYKNNGHKNYDITAIIYMEDSDGDLIIYDCYAPDEFNKNAKFKRITPKKNRCVIMMKHYWHHPCFPVKTDLRYSININLKEAK